MVLSAGYVKPSADSELNPRMHRVPISGSVLPARSYLSSSTARTHWHSARTRGLGAALGRSPHDITMWSPDARAVVPSWAHPAAMHAMPHVQPESQRLIQLSWTGLPVLRNRLVVLDLRVLVHLWLELLLRRGPAARGPFSPSLHLLEPEVNHRTAVCCLHVVPPVPRDE